MIVKEKIIRDARIKKQLSQDFIADYLEISQSKYSRLENGEIQFHINELSKLIDLLELNPLEVIDFSEKQQVFINSSYSGNINSNVNNSDIELIRSIVIEELSKTKKT